MLIDCPIHNINIYCVMYGTVSFYNCHVLRAGSFNSLHFDDFPNIMFETDVQTKSILFALFTNFPE